jgi:DNA polymerase V
MPRLVQPEVEFFAVAETNNPILVRYFNGLVPAGFPSPAADYMEDQIDLNKLLIAHPSATFFIKVKGDSMKDAFIPDGATLIVDRSVKAVNNSIVLAVVNGEFTVKRFIKNSSGIRLMPANEKYKPIPIVEGMEFYVWGTVTKIIIDAINI